MPKEVSRRDIEQSKAGESAKPINPMLAHNFNCHDKRIIPQPFVLNLFSEGTLRLCN